MNMNTDPRDRRCYPFLLPADFWFRLLKSKFLAGSLLTHSRRFLPELARPGVPYQCLRNKYTSMALVLSMSRPRSPYFKVGGKMPNGS